MKASIVDVVAVFTCIFLCCILFSLYAMYKRQKLKKNQILQLPLPSELRKNRVPVIESTPFWVPSYIGHMVDIQVQPSLDNLGPKFSTPKPKRKKISEIENPQLKFAVKYIARRSALMVELLESKHLGKGNLVHDVYLEDSVPEASFLSETGVFSAVELSPTVHKDSRMQVVRRTRKNSYEFEMSYEDLQLQCLQFSVMAFDEYSRQKVIGDVILPMADLTSQGLDVTRELIMWREIQTMEKKASSMSTEQRDENQNLIEARIDEIDGKPTSESTSRRCSPS